MIEAFTDKLLTVILISYIKLTLAQPESTTRNFRKRSSYCKMQKRLHFAKEDAAADPPLAALDCRGESAWGRVLDGIQRHRGGVLRGQDPPDHV